MSLWCDKYRPTLLAKLDYNLEQDEQLTKLIQNNYFPHLLIYGPSGAGKKTRIKAILRELFCSNVDKLRMENHQFETPSKRKIEVRTVASNYHIEVNPSDCGIFDRVALLELVKEAASVRTLNDKALFSVFIVTEADKLTKEAQQGLRRTMEKHSENCRFFLSAESSSRLIPAIKSRCLLLRVSSPKKSEIVNILLKVATKESFNLSDEAAEDIANNCERNLRRALMMAETMKISSKQKVVQPQWHTFIKSMGDKLMTGSGAVSKTLEEARTGFYELQAHLIPPELIFRCLLDHLIQHPRMTKPIKCRMIRLATFFEHKMRLGSKHVIHFEAFAAHLLRALKTPNSLVEFREEGLLQF